MIWKAAKARQSINRSKQTICYSKHVKGENVNNLSDTQYIWSGGGGGLDFSSSSSTQYIPAINYNKKGNINNLRISFILFLSFPAFILCFLKSTLFSHFFGTMKTLNPVAVNCLPNFVCFKLYIFGNTTVTSHYIPTTNLTV